MEKRRYIIVMLLVFTMITTTFFSQFCAFSAYAEEGSDIAQENLIEEAAPEEVVAEEVVVEETPAPEPPQEDPVIEEEPQIEPEQEEVVEEITQLPEEEVIVGSGSSDLASNNNNENEQEVKQEEEPEEDEEKMPAFSASGSAGGVSVSASAPKGTFPAGTKMQVAGASEAQVKALADSVMGEGCEVVDAVAVDITFYNGGSEVQPAGGNSVAVSLSAGSAVGGEDHKAVHVDGGLDIVGGASAGHASFKANHFSVYGIIGVDYESDIEQFARYTYVFKVNGDEVDRQTVKNGEEVVAPEDPAVDGFNGWEIDGSITSFPLTASIPEDETEDKEIVVNANFEDVFYAVFYKDASKNGVLQIKEGKPGDTAKCDVTFLYPDGKAIIGWTVEGSSAAVSEVKFEDSDISLIPILSEEAVQVTFVTGEGTPVAPIFVEKGKTIKAPAAPTRSGYNFTGWFTDEACTKKFNFDTKVNNNLTLYAGWIGMTTSYRVVHWKQNANDDNYSFVEMEIETGSAGTNAGYTPKNYGNGFTLNAARTNSTVLIRGDGTTIKNVYYDRKTYTLTFKVYKGLNSWEEVGTYNYKYDEDTTKAWTEVNEKNTGLVWRDTQNETSTILGDAKRMPAKDWTLYGRTGDGSGLIMYIAENENGLEIRDRFIFAHDWSRYATDYKAPAVAGFSYSRKTGPKREKIDKETYNSVGRVYYTRNKYAIQFMTNGGPEIASVRGIPYEGSLASYNPAGYRVGETTKTVNGITYTFEGWCSDESLQQAFSFNGKMPALEVTINSNRPQDDKSTLVLYAKWRADEHTVSFDLNGGTYDDSSSIPAQAVESGKEATAPDARKLEKSGGYSFAYWEDESGNRFSFDTQIIRDYELKARWNSDNSIIVTLAYDVNGGTGTITDDTQYQMGSYAVIKGQPKAPEGKRFIGWKIGGSDLVIAGGSFEIKPEHMMRKSAGRVLTLTAQYGDKAKYDTSVIYNGNGGTIDGEATVVDEEALVNGDYVVKSFELIRDGFDFLGWSTDANAEKAMLKAGDKIASGRGDNVLYAVWKEIEEEITDPGDDPEDPDNPDNPVDPEDPEEPIEPKVEPEYEEEIVPRKLPEKESDVKSEFEPERPVSGDDELVISDNTAPSKASTSSGRVQTADTVNILLFAVAILLSFAALTIMALRKKR